MNFALWLLLLGGDETRTDGQFRFEPSLNLSVEFWPGSGAAVGGASLDNIFLAGMATDGQIGLGYYWTPGNAGFDLMVRPFVGYAYRKFDGQKFTTAAGMVVRPDSLTVQTAYGGVSLGGGHLPESDEFGYLIYITGQVGQAFQDHVMAEAPALFAGKRELFDRGEATYYGGGVGVELRKEWVGVHVEVGARSFGALRQGSGPIAVSSNNATVLYVVIGATFSW